MKHPSQPLPASSITLCKTESSRKIRGLAWFSLGGRVLAAVAATLLVGARSFVEAAPPEVAFPAAAGIKPGVQPLGPVRVAPEPAGTSTPTALVPNDVVIYDYGYTGAQSGNSSTGGAIFNVSVHNGGAGAENIIASPSVGSGPTYGQVCRGTPSPFRRPA